MGEIRHPQLIGAVGAELAVDPIQGARQGLVGNGCFNRLIAPNAFPPELMPDLAYVIKLEALFPNTPDLHAQPGIAFSAGGRPGRIH